MNKKQLKTRKDNYGVTTLERPQDVNFEHSHQIYFHCIISSLISSNVCLKH